MSSNLLFVPFRKTQNIEFGSQLRQIIAKEYYQTPTVFEKDIQEVDTLRNDIIDLGVSLQDDALLKRYYINLTTLESKFPKDIIEFPWFGTLGYHSTGPVKLKSIFFERINLIYNIGALYTQLAINEDRTTDNGLKKSCLYFQYAATYFDYINQLSEQNKSITLPLDLQKDTIETLKYLCLAQAQEVFWQKAFIEKTKDSLIARLAIQVSDYYDKSLQNIIKSEGFRTEWNHHIIIKKAHFSAAAEYRASLASVSNSKYGEEVARLIKSSKIISNSTSSLKFVSLSVKEDFKSLEKIVNETLIRSEKDNDLIYLQDVPNTVPEISKAPVVKFMNIDEIKKPFESIKSGKYGNLLFKDLLPFFVIQTAEAFRDRQEEYVNKHIVQPVQALSSILTKFLAEKGLPASIDSIDKPQTLPSGLLEHHQEIKSLGGSKQISQTLHDVQKLSLSGEHLIQGAIERLNVEQQEDSLLRSRQGSNHWTRESSEEAARKFHERIELLNGFLKDAKKGDETIKNDFLQIEEPLNILGGTISKIQEYVPNSRNRELDPSLKRIVSQLKDLLTQSRKLEIEYKTFIETVGIKSSQYNILPKIISEYKSLSSDSIDVDDSTIFEPIFEKHIKNFSTDLDSLEKFKKKQKDLENKIEDLNNQFIHLNKSQGKDNEREQVLQKLDVVYFKFKDLISNLSQGLNFYNDFNSNVQQLINDIDEFVYKRRIEARDLENELNSKFQQMQIEQENINRISKVKNIPERSSSPALVAPKAKPAKTKGGIWRPENGINF